MSDSAITRRKRRTTTGIAAGVLAAALAFWGPTAWAHEETPGTIEGFLHGLVEGGAITEAQHRHIEETYFKGHLEQLVAWLDAQETAGRIAADTRLYLDALLHLGAPEIAPAPAPADYTGNGNVTLLGQINVQPPNPYYGDNSSTGQLYNGIWGYAAGAREYALQCNSFGLHVVDVTAPAAPFRVQYIDMSGGVSPPKGRIWRDADIHYDPPSGKTYAYVGAQSGGNLWVVDLSYLSGSTPHGVDSNPIPPAGIADRDSGDTCAADETSAQMSASAIGTIFASCAEPVGKFSILGCFISSANFKGRIRKTSPEEATACVQLIREACDSL